MPETMRLRLPDLNPALVKKLEEKYGPAEVELSIRPDSAPAEAFSEAHFWQIIALFDWGRAVPSNIIAPAVEALSHRSESDIFRFDDLLAERLFALDGEQFAAVGADEKDHFSVDGFLYDRCGAVANGRDFYEKTLKKPIFFPKNRGFEALLSLAQKAYALRTGRDGYDYLPALSYETFSNSAGWPGRPTAQNLILGLPK